MERSCIPTKLRNELKELGVYGCFPCPDCGAEQLFLSYDTDNAIREMAAQALSREGYVAEFQCPKRSGVPSREQQKSMEMGVVVHIQTNARSHVPRESEVK